MPYASRIPPQLLVSDNRYEHVKVYVLGGGQSVDRVYTFNEYVCYRCAIVLFAEFLHRWLGLHIPCDDGTTLPISIFCQTQWDVRDIKTIAPLFTTLIGLNPGDQANRLDAYAQLASNNKLTRHWKWWAVLNGKGDVRFITSKWYVPFRFFVVDTT